MTERFCVIDLSLKYALIDSCKVLKTYKFVIEAVFFETFMNDALVDS